MKWIILDNKYINANTCTDVVFSTSECDNEMKLTIKVSTINNTFSCTYYSKVDKLNVDMVKDKFHEFIMDDYVKVFAFLPVCRRIEVNNS